MSLSNKVITGGLWRGPVKILQAGSSLLITAVLAKFLSPKDFGLIGQVTVYVGLISFASVGFGASVIQKQDIDETQLSTLFWMNLGMGFILFSSSYLLAPLAGAFYQEPQLPHLIRLLSINFLLSPIYQLHRKLMEKELRFPALSKIDLSAAMGAGLVGIALAWLGQGVYSLVFQSLVLTLCYVVMINLCHPWHPRKHFSLRRVKDLVQFSLKMKGASLSNYLERNVDFMILGKLLSTANFGYYSFAYRLLYFPVRTFSYVFTEILFPAFSTIQQDFTKIKLGYLKSIKIAACITFPIMTTIALFAEPLVEMIWGEKWLPITNMLVLFAIAGALQTIDQIGGTIYPAINRVGTALKIGVLRTGLIAVGVTIGSSYGLFGAAIGVLAAIAVAFIIGLLVLISLTSLGISEFLNAVRGPILGVALMVLVFFVMRLGSAHGIIQVTSSVLFLGTVYSVSVLSTNFHDIKLLVGQLRPRFH